MSGFAKFVEPPLSDEPEARLVHAGSECLDRYAGISRDTRRRKLYLPVGILTWCPAPDPAYSPSISARSRRAMTRA